MMKEFCVLKKKKIHAKMTKLCSRQVLWVLVLWFGPGSRARRLGTNPSPPAQGP